MELNENDDGTDSSDVTWTPSIYGEETDEEMDLEDNSDRRFQ